MFGGVALRDFPTFLITFSQTMTNTYRLVIYTQSWGTKGLIAATSKLQRFTLETYREYGSETFLTHC